MTDHLRAALEAARSHIADGHSCNDTRGDCSDHMERVYRAALAADARPGHPDDDFVARAQRYRDEHEDEMCGGPCIVLGLAAEAQPGLDAEMLGRAFSNAEATSRARRHSGSPLWATVAAEYARLTEDRP